MSDSTPQFDSDQIAALRAAGLGARQFRGLSIYQDVVLNGRTVLKGERDCRARWRLMEPRLPRRGAVLDVGANFGWFGLQLLGHSPELTVASVEADARSAFVQRCVLASHEDRRICLLMRRAGLPQLASFAASGQRFSAALCLSVLHWMPEHREYLTTLGAMCDRLFLEMPDRRENGSGDPRICAEIGAGGDYLHSLFPQGRIELLGTTPNHRFPDLPRELWQVEWAADGNSAPVAGLDVAALLCNDVSWPPRSWWQDQADSLTAGGGRLAFGPHGLSVLPAAAGKQGDVVRVRRSLQSLPESELASRPQRWQKRARAIASRVGLTWAA